MGGTQKALLRRSGQTLLDAWVCALQQRQVPAVVVGPESLRGLLPAGWTLTREEPPLSGPAAAVCTGVRALPEPAAVTLLLAVDTVDPGAVLDWLIGRMQRLAADQPGASLVPRGAENRLQPLTAALDTGALVSRVSALPPGTETGRPMHWLLEGIKAEHPELPARLGRDVDTPEQARQFGVEGFGTDE